MRPCATLCFGPFVLDGTDDGLWRGPQRCKLTAKAQAVLRYLVEHPGRLVRKADLLTAVWPDVYVSEWALTTCIRELRRVLGDSAKSPQYIVTVHRQGYRFIAPVTVTEVSPQTSVSTPSTPETVLPAFTPPGVDAEYKLVTVLCGALADASALATQLDPEGWYHLLQTVLGLSQDVIQPYDGTLTVSSSGGFTVVFGMPLAQEDHARRAILAACELHQRLCQHPDLRSQHSGLELALSLGLHSGLVVVGSLGQDLQSGNMAIGAPLHVATRLQQQSAPGTTLLSAATYRLVQAEVRAVPCGVLALDGQPTSLPVYAVLGLRERHAGVMGRGSQVCSPFVGRRRELALLHDCLAVARTGQGQVVGLMGEPGMGKTRLVTEFRRRLAGQSVRVYVVQCLSYGQATPYLPVCDLVRQVCALAKGDAAEAQFAAVRHQLHDSGITAEEDITLMCQLLDLPVALKCLEQLSPQARQARTFALLRHLVVHVAQHQPLVLVVENLHWIDPTSEAWMMSLVECLSDTAVLLIGTFRPGYQVPWGAHATVTQVALPSLRVQESRAVVQAVLGALVLPEVRLRAIIASAMGNPFFLEELAWHAVEQDRPDSLGAVPETVHAVLAAWMDRLSPEDKRLLQTSAVIGTDIPLPLLQAIVDDMSEDTLHLSLAHLQTAAFLYERRLFPEPEYAFKHALTHEVAYGSLLHERRRVLHARIVEALETLGSNRLDDQIERLAHHAFRGEVWDKTLLYYRQAGDKAMARSAFHEAVVCCEQALVAVQHLPEQHDTLVQAIDLYINLDNALLASGQPRRGFEYLREAERLAEILGDQRRLGQICAFMIHFFFRTGDYDHATAYGQRALALTAAHGDAYELGEVQGVLGTIYYYLGDYRHAVDVLNQSATALEGELHHKGLGMMVPAVRSRAWLVMCFTELGKFAEGLACGEEASWMAERAGHLSSGAIFTQWQLGRLFLRQGNLQRAMAVFECALADCRAADISLFISGIAASLGLAYALSGQVDAALPLLEQAVEQLSASAQSGGSSDMLRLGEAYLLADRLADAAPLAEHALTLSHDRKERANLAWALRLNGEIARHRYAPEIESAKTHYQQALTLANELGMRPLQAHCHRGLGIIYSQTGQAERARAELSMAIDMYRDMDMTFWLPETEAALARWRARADV